MDDDFAADGIIVRTAAELLQVPLEEVQRLIDARVLDARRIGSRVYVRRAAVLALQAERRDVPVQESGESFGERYWRRAANTTTS